MAKPPIQRLLIENANTPRHNVVDMEQFIKKIEQVGIVTGDVIWPAIIIFLCLIFRKQIVKGISSLTATHRPSQTNEPLENSKYETQNDPTQSEVRGLDPELIKLAEFYSNLDLQNQVESIRTKDAIARDMSDLVIRKNLSRDLLAEEHNEAIILALASTVRTKPEPEDAERLLRVANRVNEHHVKYRVALAFGMLLAKKLVSPSLVTQINEVMTRYEQNADGPLQHRLQHTQKMLSLYGQQGDE